VAGGPGPRWEPDQGDGAGEDGGGVDDGGGGVVGGGSVGRVGGGGVVLGGVVVFFGGVVVRDVDAGRVVRVVVRARVDVRDVVVRRGCAGEVVVGATTDVGLSEAGEVDGDCGVVASPDGAVVAPGCADVVAVWAPRVSASPAFPPRPDHTTSGAAMRKAAPAPATTGRRSSTAFFCRWRPTYRMIPPSTFIALRGVSHFVPSHAIGAHRVASIPAHVTSSQPTTAGRPTPTPGRADVRLAARSGADLAGRRSRGQC